MNRYPQSPAIARSCELKSAEAGRRKRVRGHRRWAMIERSPGQKRAADLLAPGLE